MLLTYGQSADIPNKLNVFYNQAYEALYQRHDALKGAFQRERSCNLDIQDFAKVFSAFSIQTYDKRIFQMSKSDALSYAEKSKKIIGIEFNTNNFLTDAQQAVCLLVEEGLLLTFSHRSFQEFFVAKFINNSKSEVQQKLIDKYANTLSRDSVIQLLYEMNPELIERALIIPGLEKLERHIKLKRNLGLSHYLRYFKSTISQIVVENDEPRLYIKDDHFFV